MSEQTGPQTLLEVFDVWPEHPRATRNWSHRSSASISEYPEISFERLHLDPKRKKVNKNCSHTSSNQAGSKHKMLPLVSAVVKLCDRMPTASSNGTFFPDLFCSCTLEKNVPSYAKESQTSINYKPSMGVQPSCIVLTRNLWSHFQSKNISYWLNGAAHIFTKYCSTQLCMAHITCSC